MICKRKDRMCKRNDRTLCLLWQKKGHEMVKYVLSSEACSSKLHQKIKPGLSGGLNSRPITDPRRITCTSTPQTIHTLCAMHQLIIPYFLYHLLKLIKNDPCLGDTIPLQVEITSASVFVGCGTSWWLCVLIKTTSSTHTRTAPYPTPLPDARAANHVTQQ